MCSWSHESSFLHSYRWPATNFTWEERNWGLQVGGYRCSGLPWPFWACSGTALNQPVFSCTAGESVPKAIGLLPPSLEEEYLVTSVVALVAVLWFFWFSSAGAAQGSCSELVHRKALVATDSCWVLLHPPLEEENGWNRLDSVDLDLACELTFALTALSLGSKSSSWRTVLMSRSSWAESHLRIWSTVLRGALDLYISLAVLVEIRVCCHCTQTTFFSFLKLYRTSFPKLKAGFTKKNSIFHATVTSSYTSCRMWSCVSKIMNPMLWSQHLFS